MICRPASSDDADVIEQVSVVGSSGHWHRADVLASLSDTSRRVWVAEDAAEIAGFCVMSVVADESEVLEIAVFPAHRRKGVARALLSASLADARERGAARCFLDVRSRNVPARALYAGFGFAATGVRRGYYRDDGDDAIVMALELVDGDGFTTHRLEVPGVR